MLKTVTDVCQSLYVCLGIFRQKRWYKEFVWQWYICHIFHYALSHYVMYDLCAQMASSYISSPQHDGKLEKFTNLHIGIGLRSASLWLKKYFKHFLFKWRCQLLVGASVQTYLLEKTRIACQPANERNFHIFYQVGKLRPIGCFKMNGFNSN